MIKIKHVILYMFFINKLISQQQKPNNVCNTYYDYFRINSSKNCDFNPDIHLKTVEIIERHVGISETYTVTTLDGYILTIFRIPRTNPKGVIVMQHPVTADSIVWVGQSDQSLAFLLWNSGYDIWLPNQRGTLYSQKHLNYSTSDPNYWDFTFHEIGVFDYKAVIDFVRRKTGSNKLISIAHSMSTTSSIIYSALRPQEAANSIKIFINMSPIAYLRHVNSPVRLLTHITPLLKTFNRLFRQSHLLEHDSELLKSARNFFFSSPFKLILTLLLSFFEGWTPLEFDPALINHSVAYFPRTYSWKLFYHYSQQVLSGGRFQLYDYGVKSNLKLYGSPTPPEYPVEKIIAPTYLIYSVNDTLSTPQDCEFLYEKLGSRAKVFGKLEIKGLNHVDFHYGRHRKEILYERIFQLLDKI